eukprot:6763888-Karenia_brevis.AAC.1
MRYWRVEPPAFVTGVGDLQDEGSHSYQATSTLCGLKKLEQRELKNSVQFLAGEDYHVKEEGSEMWLPFPDQPTLKNI